MIKMAERDHLREQRKCQSRKGLSQRQILGLRRNFGDMPNLLRVKRDGERNFGYTPRIRSCYGLNSRDELENSYRKDTVLFETASDHLLMTGFAAAGVAWRLVMFLSWHEQDAGKFIVSLTNPIARQSL
jgi:hypothetical protein